MTPKANFDNKSSLSFNVIEGDPSNIKQEKIHVNYNTTNNEWKIRDSVGVSFVRGKSLNFNGYQLEVMGEPKDNDGFIISPSMATAYFSCRGSDQ